MKKTIDIHIRIPEDVKKKAYHYAGVEARTFNSFADAAIRDRIRMHEQEAKRAAHGGG